MTGGNIQLYMGKLFDGSFQGLPIRYNYIVFQGQLAVYLYIKVPSEVLQGYSQKLSGSQYCSNHRLIVKKVLGQFPWKNPIISKKRHTKRKN